MMSTPFLFMCAWPQLLASSKVRIAPELLYFMGMLILCVCVVYASRHVDRTFDMDTPDMLNELNPYTIALLRGGIVEVATLIVFDLARRGYLEYLTHDIAFGKEVFIQRAQNHPDVAFLSHMERSVFEYVQEPVLAKTMLRSHKLGQCLTSFCTANLNVLEHMCLVHTAEEQKQSLRAFLFLFVVMCVAMCVAMFLFPEFFSMNVRKVVAMSTGSVLCAGAMYLVCLPKSISNRGQRYLRSLQDAYAPMHEHLDLYGVYAEAHILLLGAIYGPRILEADDEVALWCTNSMHLCHSPWF